MLLLLILALLILVVMLILVLLIWFSMSFVFFMQRMVVSLSSDAAVWDAVMNNEVVQQLRRSFHEGICKKKFS